MRNDPKRKPPRGLNVTRLDQERLLSRLALYRSILFSLKRRKHVLTKTRKGTIPRYTAKPQSKAIDRMVDSYGANNNISVATATTPWMTFGAKKDQSRK